MNELENFKQTLLNIKRAFQSSDLLVTYEKKLDGILKNMDEPINVMILGEFNAGKSTLINTLLKDNYLRMDDVPTTAAVTKLVYGESIETRLVFEDGREQVYSTDHFEQISAEIDEEGAKIRETLSYIQVSYPSEILKRITLIDTPGRNSTNQTHTKATESFMDQADVAYWLFELTQIGTFSELALLKKLNKYVHPIGIINRIDEMDEDDTLENIIGDAYARLNPYVTAFIGISALYANDAILTDDEDLLEESNWEAFIQSLEKEISGDRVQSRKINRMYQELEKTLLSVKIIIDEAKELFNETFKQLNDADNYKYTLRQEIQQIKEIIDKWSKLSNNSNYNDLLQEEWPLHSTQDEGLKEEWEEQLFFMEELLSKDDVLKLEEDNLKLEELQLNEWIMKLKKDWEEYENSGLFGGEPILFKGRKTVLENEQLQLNEDIKAYENREYDFSYRAQSHEETKRKGLYDLRSIAYKVVTRLEDIHKQKIELYNDKGYLEKAKETLSKTKWLPEFLDKVKVGILPYFEETYNSMESMYRNEQTKSRYSECLSILMGFMDESVSLEAYNKLLDKIEGSMNEKEIASPKKSRQKNYRYKEKKTISFSWLKPLTSVAAIIVIIYIVYIYQEPMRETAMNVFNSIEQMVTGGDTANNSLHSDKVTVTADDANIRQEPNLNATIVKTVQKGETISAFDSATDADGREWINVEFPTGETGWISSKIIEW